MARVLVADDYEDFRELAMALLGAVGHEVLQATNGIEAVQAAIEHHPDLILMDVMMPVLDGQAAARELQRRPDTRAIPVIAVTASPDPTLEREPAFAAVIRKPLDIARLQARIEGLLESSRG